MAFEITRLDDLAAELVRRANAAGARLIWRAQERLQRRVVVRDGRAEAVSAVAVAGQGLHAFDERGHGALASRDDLQAAPAVALLERAIEVARQGDTLGLEPALLPALPPLRAERLADDPATFRAVELGAVIRRLVELEERIRGTVPGVKLQLSYRAELEAWRIVRSDGTDVSFSIPRCTLAARATSDGAGARHGVPAVVFDPSPGLLDDGPAVDRFLRRAEAAARLARALPDAPPHPAGSFPVVIDYALAKGLAHEAFGHASEADGYRSSVLASEGRFRTGERVGAEQISIIDEPIEGDHAWQPFSANGLVRRRAVIVENGVLRDGLSDPWSAGPGGVALTGAGRAESFRNAPQPRMTNIRIEVADPLPAPGEFEDYGPRELRQLLQEAGVFRRHPRVVFLSGYSGGQVNTATGDFVFQCKAIYDLGPQKIELYKPAIFSGSMFGALGAIREAFGPLQLDAIGYCGKWGQSVPSSGGSHYFLMLEPDPSVRLGGR